MCWTNCSTSENGTDYDNNLTDEDEDGFHRQGYEPYRRVVFTTIKGSRQANLTTLTVPAVGSLSGDGVMKCALLTSPAPAPNPCKSSVAPEAASSISSSLTRAECSCC
ncbi:uncharacterized protein ATNIH1004_001558 [Aspergillus tanneri]|uniref:DUF7136 domain-containing protein n=1 Tax=Aspergillus tanneri TaxID=1220188 RepID=A0A5M9N5V3_9EURO|nr:uncharacterized protein ATNIH1004_001558 [Aspergillus tanneri]KAA8652653.1 hypothetical protein ATNIH1004_001558 [Aspergillus tanneri]